MYDVRLKIDYLKTYILGAAYILEADTFSCSNLRTDSPTCLKMSMRLTIDVASSMKWQINSLDIQRAFLQGKQ